MTEEMSMTRTFFEEMVPIALRDNRPLFTLMQGSICIAVQEEGAWTLRFGKYEEGCYTEEFDKSAACVVIWEKEAFEKMLRQEELAEEENPKCYGDEKMLMAFGKILSKQNKGQLGIRSVH
jgi:hypothetical protein